MRRLSLYLRREWLTLALAALLALLATDVAFAPLGLRDLLALRAERARLEAVHLRLLETNTELKVKAGRLRDDDRYLQRMIREQLGYVRPGEIVYRFATPARPAEH